MSHYFSADYATARRRFVAEAQARGADLHELRLGARAPDGSPLTIDVASFGASAPARAVIHSSGLHGVEGFAGSAIQLALMRQELSIPPDGAILFVHVLNPYGMAWLRRCNENNVDLNRNFGFADRARPATSRAYRQLNPLLNPATPPAADAFYARAAYYVARYGLRHLKQGLASGQYEFPRGLFYGGAQLQEGPALYQSWLAGRLSSLQNGFAIDVHTGLGRSGRESLFLQAAPTNDEALAHALGRPLVTDAGTDGTAYDVSGGYAHCLEVLPARARIHAVTQEFGTYPSLPVLHAMRQENRWHHYGDGAMDHPAKLRLKEVFAPASDEWRETVVDLGIALGKAVAGYVFR